MTDASTMPAAAASACRRGGGGRVQQNGPSNSESVSFPELENLVIREQSARREGKIFETEYLLSSVSFSL